MPEKVDGRRTEEAAHGQDERELEPPSEVESAELQAEERLPERVVPRLDGDQLVEDATQVAGRDVAEGAVERQIEQLVEHEPPGELRVGWRSRGHLGLDLRAELGPVVEELLEPEVRQRMLHELLEHGERHR